MWVKRIRDFISNKMGKKSNKKKLKDGETLGRNSSERGRVKYFFNDGYIMMRTMNSPTAS